METGTRRSAAATLARGYLALLRELLGLKSSAAHLVTPPSVPLLVAICAVLGLARNAIAVELGETTMLGKWYSFDPDILYAMALWPSYLLFFGSMSLHLVLRVARERDVPFSKLLSFFFYLQILHLLVPLPDLINFRYRIPITFHLTEGQIITDYYTNGLSMSLGIIVVWALTAYMTIKLLVKHVVVRPVPMAVAMLVTFGLIVTKGYLIWPTYNTAFNALFGLGRPYPPVFWGYGTYFLLMTAIGIAYALHQRRAPS
jgi:hypothetical protein